MSDQHLPEHLANNPMSEPAEVFLPDNDPAYIEAIRETFQFQGVHDDTREQWVYMHLAEDY
jgi:hypothetical protein